MFATEAVMRMSLTSTGTVNTTVWKVATVLKGPCSTTVKYIRNTGLHSGEHKYFSKNN